MGCWNILDGHGLPSCPPIWPISIKVNVLKRLSSLQYIKTRAYLWGLGQAAWRSHWYRSHNRCDKLQSRILAKENISRGIGGCMHLNVQTNENLAKSRLWHWQLDDLGLDRGGVRVGYSFVHGGERVKTTRRKRDEKKRRKRGTARLLSKRFVVLVYPQSRSR